MSKFSGLAALGAKIAELEARMPEVLQQLGLNKNAQRVFNMQVMDPMGNALGPHLTPQQIERLANATPVLRRKSLEDLKLEKLQTVHESGITGSHAGPKRAIEARATYEPSLFGGNPVYGSLISDVKSPVDLGVTVLYPDTGAKIAADNNVSQYGRYGFVPKNKDKLTYTLGDSLDSGRGGPYAISRNHDSDQWSAYYNNSALADLITYYRSLQDAKASQLGLVPYKDGRAFSNFGYKLKEPLPAWDSPNLGAWEKANTNARREMDAFLPDSPVLALHELGLQGPFHGSPETAGMTKLLPRKLGETGAPLTPFEHRQVDQGALDRTLGGGGFDYVEVQGHGLTPDDIDHVIDYGIAPSKAIEQRLKKLGIGYNPIAGSDTSLAKYAKLRKEGAPRQDFVTLAKDLGDDTVASQLDSWKTDPSNVPKVGTNYAGGGLVKGALESLFSASGRSSKAARISADAAAGNYKKGHVYAHGLRISIENPAGSWRTGKDGNGEEWASRMQHDYGYIRGTNGNDGDHIDVFMSPEFKDPAHPVHVIDQHDKDGKFDEHKVMLGFPDGESALDAYRANYHDGWDGAKAVTPMHVSEFKEWATKPGARRKPLGNKVQKLADGGSVDKAAFGIYPGAGKRSKNDRVNSADMPLQAVRGWLAGTLGLPGDLTNLVKLGAGVISDQGTPVHNWSESDTFMPGSDFYKDWLPLKNSSAHGNFANDLGALFGDTGAGIGKAISTGFKGAKWLGKEAMRTVGDGMNGADPLARMLSQPAYEVKPKVGIDHLMAKEE